MKPEGVTCDAVRLRQETEARKYKVHVDINDSSWQISK
jgi:hypothetical protein